MTIITPSVDRTVATPAATMVGLAAPSQGSRELSTWRVEMSGDIGSPAHVIDREQVWMAVRGQFSFTVDGDTVRIAAGQALVVPGGAVRQFSAETGPAEALVCMPSGGTFRLPDAADGQPLPWAL